MIDDAPQICVHGLGYVGLPTAAMFANSGFEVTGFDTDSVHRQQLENGNFTFEEPDLVRFVDHALSDGLTVVGEPGAADVHIICVPTPYDKDLDRTDLSAVEAAGTSIAKLLRPDDTVILSSTVPPGTTERLLGDIIEDEGLSVTSDVLLGFSPETILPGNTLRELQENDRLIGTVGGRSADRLVSLYDSFVSGEIRTTDATTAEFVKLLQNSFRDVNIAFANEVAKLANEYGIDSQESIHLANFHPRVEILRPGPGVGGHCIPIDPLFLTEGNDIPMLIETARLVNDGMPLFVMELLSAALDELNDATVTILGVAYKGGVSDIRESPALALIEELYDYGIDTVQLTDPYVDDEALPFQLSSLEAGLEGADAAVIVTDHPEYGALSPEMFADRMHGTVIVDTRAILDRGRWERAGFDVYQV